MKTLSTAKKSAGLWDTIRTVLYALLIALGIRTSAYEPFNIPSGSMIPTLLIGDYLFVSKFSYGYSRYSLPFGLPLVPGRILFHEPQRGDVAVFKLPRDNSTDYIKRIIGLPGDRIQMIKGVLNINGEPVKRERIEDFVEGDGRAAIRYTQYIETLPNGRRHRIIELSDDAPLDNTQVYVVPAGHYFAMGDNRDNSLDSRVLNGVGYVPAVNLVGRAEFLFYSTSGEARFWEIWKWPLATRFSRMFHGID
ncbi:MAG: signal peptidase I [Proteobacteria bacterium]|nr:signal peptidase I [Pseudomonadota bacterium]MBI3499899.1 signal peptidase I [Pseudomonadota bacterium]